MPSEWKAVLTVAIFAWLAGPCMAEVDPCGPPSRTVEGERWQAGIDRDVAIYVAKHIQRACRRLSAYPDVDPKNARAKDAREGSDGLRRRLASLILDPIYDRFTELRGRDLTEEVVPALEGSRSEPQQRADRAFALSVQPDAMDRESAVSLIRIMKETQDGIFAMMTELGKGASARDRAEAVFDEGFEITSDVGFVDNPAYASFPELWREEMRRPRAGDARTDESDDAFRKRAISPRSVRFTRPARAQMRRFLIALRIETGRDQVIAVSWSLGGRVRGPNDKNARKLPPGISIGAFSQAKLPPDVVGRVGHMPVYVSEAESGEISGRTIDYRNGRFQLTNR